MNTGLIERLTEAKVFRVALVFAGIAVMPVLALGLLAVPLFVLDGEPLGWAAVAAAVGGAAGVTGWIRAGTGARNPEQHNVTATLLCLWIGVAAALAVGGFFLLGVVWGYSLAQRSSLIPVLFAAVWAAANFIWVLEALASAERLARSHAERMDAPIDGMPALMLLVAVGLATAAGFVSTTL